MGASKHLSFTISIISMSSGPPLCIMSLEKGVRAYVTNLARVRKKQKSLCSTSHPPSATLIGAYEGGLNANKQNRQ